MKLYIRSAQDIAVRLRYAVTIITQMMADGHVVLTISNETRAEIQSRKFHAMCGDVARQCEWAGKKRTAEQWKLLFVSGHAIATKEGAEILPGIENEFLNIRESTAKMGVKRMASLIEYVSAWGAGQDVKWSAPDDQC
jgi:hypothetical protein